MIIQVVRIVEGRLKRQFPVTFSLCISAVTVEKNIARSVAEAVAHGKHDRGILICGTGIGMCIAANKVDGAYAALCSDAYSTERSIKSNNVNIMTLGAQVVGIELAKSLVTIWMNSRYTPGGRSEPKIQRIYQYAKDQRHQT